MDIIDSSPRQACYLTSFVEIQVFVEILVFVEIQVFVEMAILMKISKTSIYYYYSILVSK
jgi:hypothetical protein